MNTTNVKACFTICSDRLDHSEITKKLKIVPSYVRHSNEILGNGRLFGHDEWGIETDYDISLDISEQLSKMMDVIVDKGIAIRKLCEKFNANNSFLVVINLENGQIPVMSLNSNFIEFAASINAEIGFDVHFYCDCEE